MENSPNVRQQGLFNLHLPHWTIANPKGMIMTQKYIQRVNSTLQTVACEWMAIERNERYKDK